jgi:dimethylargininase
MQRIEREATFSYQTLTVPDGIAANVLYVNGTLIHRSVDEIPESCKVRCFSFVCVKK